VTLKEKWEGEVGGVDGTEIHATCNYESHALTRNRPNLLLLEASHGTNVISFDIMCNNADPVQPGLRKSNEKNTSALLP